MATQRTFVPADYAVFAVMLFISAAIGIYYAIISRKKNIGTVGYLLANREMTMIPVAISLALSFQSSLTLLAIPAEVYLYGTMILWVNLLYVFIAIITAEIFLPTFYRLGISSTYEYLGLRFGNVARICGTLAFIASTIFYMGIVMYGPALAFEQVSGFPLWAAIISTGLVCTFYTTLGGLRGVIWTDVFQGIIIMSGLIAFLIKGSMVHGGMANIWKLNEEGGRIDFVHFETDVRIRNTVWSIVIGGTIRWAGMYAVSQSQVQRYLSCKTEKQAKKSIYLNVIGLVTLITLSCLCGLLLFAHYRDCDPIKQQCVKKPDQLMPYMMLEMFEDYPGAAGLFVSAVYAASLSSVSSGINAMTMVTIEDLIKPYTKRSDTNYMWISRVIVVFYGLLSIGMAFLLSTVTELLQAAFSLIGLMMGPLIGMFTLAVQFPFVNSIGSVAGLLSGIAAGSWCYIGRKSIKKSISLTRGLPRSVDKCAQSCGTFLANASNYMTTTDVTPWSETVAITTTQSISSSSWPRENAEASSFGIFVNSTVVPVVEYQDDLPFYTLSYHYISAIGLCVTMLVGIIVSLATNGWKHRKDVDPKLLRPPFDHWMFRSWVPEKVRKFLRFGIDWEDNVPAPDQNMSMNETRQTEKEITEEQEDEEERAPDV